MYRPTPHFLISLVLLTLIALPILPGCSESRAQVTSDTVAWDRPTTRVDGSALPAAEILQYTLSSGKIAGGPYALVATIPGTDLTFTRANRPNGRQCYVATVTDTAGLVSANSNESCTTKCPLGQRVNVAGDCVAIPAPNPPSNLRAT